MNKINSSIKQDVPAGLLAAVIGAGSWGTAFARLLANRGISTVLVCRRAEQAASINATGHNPDYLPGIALPSTVRALGFDDAGLELAGLVVVAVPSRAFRSAVHELAGRLGDAVAVLSLTKGLEPGSLLRFSQVLEQELPPALAGRIAVLSGPNHAEEVACDVPTATTLAAADAQLARALQQLLSTDTFRIYINSDLAGVELYAAIKNVIALAAGMSDGLGFGDNTKASLITRGLAEMARLGTAMGAQPHTFAGLAGIGDLIATCTSRHSRNRRAGELIAGGVAAAEVEQRLGMVAEGLTSAPSVRELAHRHGVEMPITEQVCAVLEGKGVRQAVAELMTRAPKSEMAGEVPGSAASSQAATGDGPDDASASQAATSDGPGGDSAAADGQA